MVVWLCGCVVVWLCGCVVVWLYSTVARACGVVFVVATLRFSVLNICRKVRTVYNRVWVGRVVVGRHWTNHSFPRCRTRSRFLVGKPTPSFSLPSREDCSTGQVMGLLVSLSHGMPIRSPTDLPVVFVVRSS